MFQSATAKLPEVLISFDESGDVCNVHTYTYVHILYKCHVQMARHP